MDLSSAVRKKRKELGITQKQLAEMCDVTVSTIVRFEKGKCSPHSYTLKSICNILGLEDQISDAVTHTNFQEQIKDSYNLKEVMIYRGEIIPISKLNDIIIYRGKMIPISKINPAEYAAIAALLNQH